MANSANDLLMYFLSGAGRAIGGEGSVADIIGGMTQQSIGAKQKINLQEDYMKMLQGMIGGETTNYSKIFGDLIKGGGKLSFDKDGFSLKAPKEALNAGGETGSGGAGAQPGLSTTSPGIKDLMSILNPSEAQQGTSSAYPAGLTSQDVSQALAGALSVENLRQETASGIIARALKARELASDEAYKSGMLEYYGGQASAAQTRAQADFLEQFRRIKEIPDKVDVKVGDQTLSVDPKDALSFYAKKYDLPASYETYKLAADDPEFKDHLLEMARAGAINLGDIVERKKATEDIEAQSYIKSSKFPQEVIEDIMKDTRRWRASTRATEIADERKIEYSKAKDLAQKEAVLEEMDNRIKQTFGEGVTFKRDGWYLGNERIVRNPYAK